MQAHQDPPRVVLGVELLVRHLAPILQVWGRSHLPLSNHLFIAFLLLFSYLLQIIHEINLENKKK